MEKKRVIKQILSILIVVASIVLFKSIESNAANVSIGGDTQGQVGTGMNISVSGTAAQWNLSLKVDGTTIASSSELDSIENKSISFSGTYNPSSEGTKSVTLEGTITDEDGSTTRSFGGKTLTITAKTNENNNTSSEPSTPAEPEPEQPAAPSSNANLSNLGYTPNDFTGFTPGQTEYYTTVPNDVTSISVYAYPQDDGASYSVSGNTNLDVGTNRVTVTVTAEDGTQKTYTMYVSRKEKEEKDEVTPNVIDEDKKDEKEKEDEEKLKVISIAIDDEKEIYLEPQFKSDVYKYTINIKDKDKSEKEKITTIPLKVVANQQDAEIKITGNEKLKDGENIIKITVTSKDGKEKVEYTIIVKKNVEEKPRTTYNPDAAKYSDPHIQYGWIIIGGVLVLFTIIFVIIIIRWRKNKKEEYINSEEEGIEDNQSYEEEIEEKKRRRGRSYKNGKHS